MGGKIKKFLKKQWILVWLITASLMLVTMIAFAEYGAVNNKIKRVLAPSASLGNLFTSNYLGLGSSNNRLAYFDSVDPNGKYEFPVYIRNHNPADPNTLYNGTIKYSINIQLAHSDGSLYTSAEVATAFASIQGAKPSITVSDGTNSVTLGSYDTDADAYVVGKVFGSTEQTKFILDSNNTSDTWNVIFNNIELDDDDYFVKITATPTNADLEPISATIGIATSPDVHPQGWEGKFMDATKTGSNVAIPISQYDAYNYSVLGTGEKWLYICYDPTKLDVNPFLQHAEGTSKVEIITSYKGTTGGRTGWYSLKIHANPDTDKIFRYDLQFYKVNGFDPSSASNSNKTSAEDNFKWMSSNCIELVQSDTELP